jgi:hypothetical protein
MKKLTVGIILAITVLSISACKNNQSAVVESSESTSEEKQFVMSDEVYDTISAFLHQIHVGQTEKAYAKTTDAFRETITFNEFKQLIKLGRLKEISTIEWGKYYENEADQSDGFSGTFVIWDDAKEPFSIELKNKERQWKISALKIQITKDAILAEFPGKKELPQQVKANILNIFNTLETQEKMKTLYSGLSRNARETLSEEDFLAQLETLKDSGISAPEESQDIRINDNDVVFEENQISLKGTYGVDENKIAFKLNYAFEWLWKLSGFEITKATETEN